MKIAIVTPRPDDGVSGGAENLCISLRNYISMNSDHDCEIISIPVKEDNLPQLIKSYQNFTDLNLDEFDLVISTKYPSWMVSHRNHICYMLHPLRGLYDTYSLFNIPDKFEFKPPALAELKQFMDECSLNPKKDKSDLIEFFSRLDKVRNQGNNEDLETFPGPFARELIHFLDGYALSPNRTKKHLAISSAVANRENYFPKSVPVDVAYPAPLIENFSCEAPQQYVFTVSRLDAPKRIDLIIKAFQKVPNKVDLFIAGDGPERTNLEKLALKDERIKLLGRIDDDELVQKYANALAVVYVPYEEDYGYITIEAMKSSKPVITCSDSGGPTEFVVNGENGFIVSPSEKAIAEKISYLCNSPEKAVEMGLKANLTVSNVDWKYTLNKLIEDPEPDSNNSQISINLNEKPRMLVTTTYPIYPPRGGGQARIFNLYKNLANFYDIEILSLCPENETMQTMSLAPAITETKVPVTSEFSIHDQELSRKVDWIPTTDIASIEGYKLIPDYQSKLTSLIKQADVVVCSHPFLIEALKEKINLSNTRLWFEAHNVEYDLKKNLMPQTNSAETLLASVHESEKYCWTNAEIVFACTTNDIKRLEELYGKSEAIKIEVVNGVDCSSSNYLSVEEKRELKSNLGINNKHTVLFMGSWHGPNISAAEYTVKLAAEFPDASFFIIGSCGLALKKRELPHNVIIFGELEDEEKRIVMSASDVAINPMKNGSGSNLKVLDYFANGVPVISTGFGMRGINAIPGKHFIEANLNSFPLELNSYFGLSERHQRTRKNARKLVEMNYDWNIIADRFKKEIDQKTVSI